MQTNHEHLKEFTIQDLFLNGDQYIIPVYQRNYEWGKAQIEQLLLDIRDYFVEENDRNYYTGTLIVDEIEINKLCYYETIDGQQRLTTFNLICCALKALKIDLSIYFKEPVIHFESRKNADATIQYIARNGKEQPKFENYNVNIHDGLLIIYDLFTQFKNDGELDFDGYINYLFTKVIILRVQVPKDTDLNHYFEIMNSRGEQLEKHEILKSRLMSHLNEEENSLELRRIFNIIWEACADMSNYLQLNFTKENRNGLFGKSWFHFIPQNFDDVYAVFKKSSVITSLDNHNGLSFSDIISSSHNDLLQKITLFFDQEVITDKEESQFQPVINFENFLLHTLKIKEKTSEISLDDKRLLLFFNNTLNKKEKKAEFVMDFAFQLLRTRFLLDQFVVKRKYAGGESRWSLQVVNFYPKNNDRKQDSYSYVNTFKENENHELVMLLSMFHVSTPTLVYKYWLLATLLYLNNNFNSVNDLNEEKSSQISGNNYIKELQTITQRFMNYRHLTDAKVDYNKIILYPDDIAIRHKEEYNFSKKLSYGNIENNLVFNYLDYLLWKDAPKEYKDFEFSFRSSVEHYYPQHPITGDLLNDDELLNCFGNLCLIQHGNNSRLSNHLPKAKKEYYIKAGKKDSIKQTIMMNDFDGWTINDINEHHQKMVNLLERNLFV